MCNVHPDDAMERMSHVGCLGMAANLGVIGIEKSEKVSDDGKEIKFALCSPQALPYIQIIAFMRTRKGLRKLTKGRSSVRLRRRVLQT